MLVNKANQETTKRVNPEDRPKAIALARKIEQVIDRS